MSSVSQAVDEFLALRRIAVAGVSRESGGRHGGNIVYQKLKERGYEVFAVNPNADSVEGDPCYHELSRIPDGVDGVVIDTNPAATRSVAEQCTVLGIDRVWIHRGFGQGSYSKDAHDYCRANGITAIPGGCPLMYGAEVDGGHRAIRWLASLFRQLRREL